MLQIGRLYVMLGASLPECILTWQVFIGSLTGLVSRRPSLVQAPPNIRVPLVLRTLMTKLLMLGRLVWALDMVRGSRARLEALLG